MGSPGLTQCLHQAALFPPPPGASWILLSCSSLHTCQQQLAGSHPTPGLRLTLKAGSSPRSGQRMKELLRNKQRQKKVPPAQVLSLPDLPNTQHIPSHMFLTTPGILVVNASFTCLVYTNSSSFLILAKNKSPIYCVQGVRSTC